MANPVVWLAEHIDKTFDKDDSDPKTDGTEEDQKDENPFNDEMLAAAVPESSEPPTIRRLDMTVGPSTKFNCCLTTEASLFKKRFVTTFSFPNLRIRADVIKIADARRPYDSVLLPWWEHFEHVDKSTTEIQALQIQDLVGPNDDSDFPWMLENAYLEINKPSPKLVHMELYARASTAGSNKLPIVFPKTVELYASKDKPLSKSAPDSASDWQLGFGAEWIPEIKLREEETSEDEAITIREVNTPKLTLQGLRTSDAWKFSGSAKNVDFSALAQHFDKDVRDSVVDLLSGVGIPSLAFDYVHQKNLTAGCRRELKMSGQIAIKELTLLLEYSMTRTPKLPPTGQPIGAVEWQTEWKFEASLASADVIEGKKSASLVDIIESFIPGNEGKIVSTNLEQMPFMKDFRVTPDNDKENPLIFRLVSTDTALVMTLRVNFPTGLGTVTVLFVQYKPKIQPTTKAVKRYVRVRLDNLPSFQRVPVVGTITPPIDALDYVFVQDNIPNTPGVAGARTTTATDSTSPNPATGTEGGTTTPPSRAGLGLTQADVADINKASFAEMTSMLPFSGSDPTDTHPR